MSDMNLQFPSELKYSSDHEWVKKDGDRYLVGVTAFAQSELGDIVFVEVETEGEELEKDEVFGSLEAVKTVADLNMPIAGTVAAFNGDLEDQPELVNSDPYGKGWIIAIEGGCDEHFAELMDAEAYKKMIGK